MRLAQGTVLISACTLFSLEFYLAQSLLPAYGGSSQVWTTCMVWFLSLLWAGYLVSRHLAPTFATLAGLVVAGGVGVIATWSAPFPWVTAMSPPLSVAMNLTLHAGIPFFLLSCTTPMVQGWVESSRRGQPYRLVAFSNAGSLLAVILFPAAVQTFVGLSGQRWLLTLLFGVVMAALCRLAASFGPVTLPDPGRSRMRLEWILLSGGSVAWMLAVNQFLSSEISSHPLVWAATLCLYLATYIAAFAAPAGHRRSWWVVPTALLGVCVAAYAAHGGAAWALGAHAALLWLGCMAAHRRLADQARRAESSSHAFYASIGLGGIVGSLMMAALPWGIGDLFAFSELDYAVAGWLLLLGLLWQRPRFTRIGASLAILALLGARLHLLPESVTYAERSFYGLNRVMETETHRYLFSGVTFHGVSDKANPETPLAYYHIDSPAGEILRAGDYRHVLSIGLGVGALLAYAEPGSHWTVIELDPSVIDIAKEYFPHVRAAGDRVEILRGDGRRVLESQTETYDLIVVDAFSGDSIPTHLLTREAIALYESRLTPGGEMLFHLSSRYIDLRPVFAAHQEGLSRSVQAKTGFAGGYGAFPSQWILVGRPRPDWVPQADTQKVYWTDQRAPLLPLLVLGGFGGGKP